MAASDQYQLDIGSVESLIEAWRQSAEQVAKISRRLANMHGQLESSIPSALIEGLLGQVPLMECFAKLTTAVGAANGVAQGLTQDTSKLNANLAAYVSAEAAIEAELKAVKSAHGGKPVAGGGPKHAAGAGTSSGGGHVKGGSSSGRGAGPTDSSGNSLQSPGPANYANQSQVESWINQAFKVLEADGVPASELNEAGVLLIIEHESSGNPNAINNWDSNAQAGDPSRGLMQVIGTTFNEYKLSGHGNIYDPVDNIIAGVRYALSRYGSIQNVPGVKSVDSGGSYVGY
jgi:Transglycosylase SLT domain